MPLELSRWTPFGRKTAFECLGRCASWSAPLKIRALVGIALRCFTHTFHTLITNKRLPFCHVTHTRNLFGPNSSAMEAGLIG